MKVIDLLNKIANGEEVPKKIKYQGDIYSYDEEFELYMLKGEEISLLQNVYECDLTDEIEIIEEYKEIEELEIFRNEEMGEGYFIIPKNTYFDKIDLNNAEAEICFVINKLIKAVNELKKGK